MTANGLAMRSAFKLRHLKRLKMKQGTEVSTTGTEALRIAGVGTRLFGVYSPEDDLLSVHATEEGAEDNKGNYEKQHGEGFYVDYVMLQP